MFPAKALFYALVVVLLSSTFGAAIVGLFRTTTEQMACQTGLLEAVHHLQSGFHILLASRTNTLEPLQKQFSDTTQAFTLQRWAWGLYDIGRVAAATQCTWLDSQYVKTGLIGSHQPSLAAHALYLADRGRTISIGGTTHITGTTVLPQATWNLLPDWKAPAGYSGYTRHQPSQFLLPEIVKDRLDPEKFNFPSTERVITDTLRGSLTQSFGKPCKIIAGTNLNTHQLQLQGHIWLAAKDTLYISASSRLENVLATARCIYIESGFHGSVQCFATEKIVCGPSVHLSYPSALVLYHTGAYPSTLQVQSQAQIEGSVINVHRDPFQAGHTVLLEKGCTISGMLYADTPVESYAHILGSATMAGVLSRTLSAHMENVLLDTWIDRSHLPQVYAFPLLEPQPKKCIALWLN